MRIWIISLGLLAVMGPVMAKMFTIQGDTGRNRENHPIWSLRNASNGNAVILEPNKKLSINFCLRRESNITIRDFRFSNGNHSENVMIEVDRVNIYSFLSPEDPNHNWSRFWSTGNLNRRPLYLHMGWHTLSVRFNGTADGLAIDHILLDIEDEKLTDDIFTCQLTCTADQDYNVRRNDVETEASFLVQESYKTTCPEVDNINMPIFNPSVQEYEITAALPHYRAFTNYRTENTTGCPHLSPFYWSFSNVLLPSKNGEILNSNKAKLVITQPTESTNSKIAVRIILFFKLEGKKNGMIDSEMGTIFRVRFDGLTDLVQLKFSYKGRMAETSSPEMRLLLPSKREAEWNTRDFSWTSEDYNVIIMHVESNSTKPLHMEHLSLERRPMLADKVERIYKGDDTIVEVVFSDFWWLNPDSMTVHLAATGRSYHNVSYFRIYRPIPWNGGYAQVFVLYQDGNARLLPVPPEGLEWIPFGSSVIIGQTDPTMVRPYASITDAYIDATNLGIELLYKNGGSSKLKISSSLSETRVTVSDLFLTQDPVIFPFTTFRSMYVAEGNSDVDSVLVNGDHPLHIMGNFNYLIGRSFVFRRRCMSRHLMLSPDIYIDVRRTTNAVDRRDIVSSQPFQSLLQRIQNTRYRLWTPRLRYTYSRT
ncbi:hypothetical protein MAR_025186 [Mya arenaria]|uniref:Uncharacterized protein n=1 Tax=Mya arenaria TaxID=6604 RepID=A0ABY7DXF6_MYAAR|nr:uncharacterized protein LOC128227271 [Mya arenaria]XP_052793601.1 uncharacterized protein LOC128227271 [Mya arenaria]WAR00814.1 hypothetical protein MAR_025186 [Mya arenaria]